MNELEPTNLHHKKTEVKFSNKLLLERVRRKKKEERRKKKEDYYI